MGVSTDAILAYGYDLGSEGDGLNLADPPAWLGYDDDGDREPDENTDLNDLIVRRLYDALDGVPAANPEYITHDMEQTVTQRYGVKLVSHCSGDYRMWILAAWHVEASRGYPQRLDLDELRVMQTRDDFDEKLRKACEVLGFTPTAEGGGPVEPGWLLASDWG